MGGRVVQKEAREMGVARVQRPGGSVSPAAGDMGSASMGGQRDWCTGGALARVGDGEKVKVTRGSQVPNTGNGGQGSAPAFSDR